MTPEELDRWAHAYIEVVRHYDGAANDGSDHPLWWAISRFHGMYTGETDPRDCWRAILRIVELEPPEIVIRQLGAGPIEDLISDHGEQFIDAIEHEAKYDPLFRDALLGAWQSETSEEIWARIQKARGKP